MSERAGVKARARVINVLVGPCSLLLLMTWSARAALKTWRVCHGKDVMWHLLQPRSFLSTLLESESPLTVHWSRKDKKVLICVRCIGPTRNP